MKGMLNKDILCLRLKTCILTSKILSPILTEYICIPGRWRSINLAILPKENGLQQLSPIKITT